MVLKSLKKKCDDISRSYKNQDVHVPENDIAFCHTKERYDIMTYHYPLDDLSAESNLYYNRDVRHHIAAHMMNKHDWKHRAS